MSDFRKRVLEPALIPVVAFVFIGVLVFGFSRFLLTTTTEGSVVLGTLMAGSILFAAGALAKGGSLKAVQRIALIAAGLLVIGGGISAGEILHTRPVEGHLEVKAEITAQNLAFDKKELDLPADEAFKLKFVNKDAQPHNVALYRSPTDKVQALFTGAIFTGPATREYEIKKGIPKGLYYFQCDVHANMNGVAKVGGATGPAPAATGTAPAPAGSTVSLSADKLAFDKTEIVLPADNASTIDFDNRETGVQHNVAIYTDAQSFDALFLGSLIAGPAKTRYQVPPLKAGTYQFRCVVHPAMSGTVVVR